MSVSTESIRNIAITGHGATGKTTLFERLLFAGGAIPKLETVESGKTVSDYHEDEISRKISIHLALAPVEWKNTKINLLDTPGASDFVGEVVAGLRAGEMSCVVVGADVGVQIETMKIWRRLNDRDLPRIVFVNKMDKEHADFDKTLADLREKFGVNLAPITIPVGSGREHTGIIDLVENAAFTGGPEAAAARGDIPADMADAVEEARIALMEAAAEGDDELMEKYLEEEALSDDEISRGLAEGFTSNKVVPVVCGSALGGTGIEQLLNFLASSGAAPSGTMSAVDPDGNEAEVTVAPGETLRCFVFKTSIDQFSGRLSFVKVVSGTLSSSNELTNIREGKRERISKIYTCVGKDLAETPSLDAGDIGVLTKLATVVTNDTLAEPNGNLSFPPLKLPQPVHAVTITAASKKDEDKLAQALSRVAEEDLTFRIAFNPETKETVASGMGEQHLMNIFSRIKDQQKVDIETSTPRVAYRETITKSSGAEYQHKKQTGGHGQYARVELEIKPIDQAKHFEFVNAVVGGAISRGYIPGVEKGIIEGMEGGSLAGYPMTGIEAKVVDGKEHPVDSSEMAFRLAARGALRAAMDQAKAVLLEPIMNLTVFVDDQHLGDVLSDLSSRRGKVQGQEAIGGGIQEIDAQVPQAELLRYSIDLRSITSGTASFEMEFSHYHSISGKIAEDVIKAAKVKQSEEE